MSCESLAVEVEVVAQANAAVIHGPAPIEATIALLAGCVNKAEEASPASTPLL